MKFGLKVKFKDPEDETKLITADFATIRGHQEMDKYLRNIAKLNVEDSVVGKKFNILYNQLEKCEDISEIDKLKKSLVACQEAKTNAELAIIDAIHKFVEEGFKLAGANENQITKLANCVGLEQLDELKTKCMYGAGVVDFTKTDDQTKAE